MHVSCGSPGGKLAHFALAGPFLPCTGMKVASQLVSAPLGLGSSTRSGLGSGTLKFGFNYEHMVLDSCPEARQHSCISYLSTTATPGNHL